MCPWGWGEFKIHLLHNLPRFLLLKMSFSFGFFPCFLWALFPLFRYLLVFPNIYPQTTFLLILHTMPGQSYPLSSSCMSSTHNFCSELSPELFLSTGNTSEHHHLRPQLQHTHLCACTHKYTKSSSILPLYLLSWCVEQITGILSVSIECYQVLIFI